MSPTTNRHPTGRPSRPSTASSVATAITRSSTSGFTSSGSRSAVWPVSSVWNSRSTSTTTSVSNWLLPVIPPTQQIRSVKLMMPRVSATSIALRSWASRWLENDRTWIVSANAVWSSLGSMGLRVTRMVLSFERTAPGSMPPMKVSPKIMIARQSAPRATRSASRNIRRFTRFCWVWTGRMPPKPPISRS